MMRVITVSKEITREQEKAHEQVQIEILANHANRRNAKHAQMYSVVEAEKNSEQWDKFIKKEVLVHNLSQVKEVEEFEEKRQKLTKAIDTKK